MGVLAAGVALLFMKLHHGVHHAFHAIRLNVRGRPSALTARLLPFPPCNGCSAALTATLLWAKLLLICALHATAGEG
jgi:hypothetical protein